MKRKRILVFLVIMLLSMVAMSFVSLNAFAEENTNAYTTVNDNELVGLDLGDDSTMFYVTATRSAPYRVKFTPNENYSLKDVTDIAIRIKTSKRQFNKPNENPAMCSFNIKFKNYNTIFNIKNEQFIVSEESGKSLYTHFVSKLADGTINKMLGCTAQGYLGLRPTYDGTAYIPLNFLYDGTKTSDADKLTAVTDYNNFEIEYIELALSSYRYDIIVGDIALVKQINNEVSLQKMSFSRQSLSAELLLLNDYYDDVKLILNNTTVATNKDGVLEAEIANQGKVKINSKLMFFETATLSSVLEEGYGITSVITSIEKEGQIINSETKNPISNEYVSTATLSCRTNRPDNTSAIGIDKIVFIVEVQVTKLVKVEFDGINNDVIITYGSKDNANDGKIYLANNCEAVLTVTPKANITFTGLEIDGVALTNIATESGEYQYKVKLTEDTVVTVNGLGESINIKTDVQSGIKATVLVDNVAIGENISTNMKATIIVTATTDKGYTLCVYKVDGENETAVAATNGEFRVYIDKAFTLKVTTTETEYEITYRYNGGSLANNETNPTTITYFDSIDLKTPTKTGYKFNGWKIQGQSSYITKLENIESDITVIAEFEREIGGGNDDNPPEKTSGCSSQVAYGFIFLSALVIVCSVILFVKRNAK